MSPGRLDTYSISGTKKLCVLVMCSRLASRLPLRCEQNRQSVSCIQNDAIMLQCLPNAPPDSCAAPPPRRPPSTPGPPPPQPLYDRSDRR